MQHSSSSPFRWIAGAITAMTLALPTAAHAAPEAHLLRVDPRAGINGGTPTLTTLVELGQFKPISEVTGVCGALTGVALANCYADAVEKPNALWTPLAFPDQNANLLVKVEGADMPATFLSKTLWRDSKKEAGMGTAWLLAVDCASSMGNRYKDAREIAFEFIKAMGPQDQVRVLLFDDRNNAYTADSKWKSFKERSTVVNLLNQHNSTARSSGAARPLFDTVKNMISNGFADLGNVGTTTDLPIHQAFVLLSNGAGREDALSNAGGALQIQQYATEGRISQNDSSSLKMPLPLISIHLPNSTGGLSNRFMANNDSQFMQSLANTNIGGYYSIVGEGQGTSRGARIAAAVNARFNAMYVVKWKLSCLNPTVEQSFNLAFTNVKQAIKNDGSFKNVPLGVDPSQWPLDINVQATQAAAQQNPVHPGGQLKVFGNFCWGGDKNRAEAYYIPQGMPFDPNMKNGGVAAARTMMQNLVAQNMRGAATDTNSGFVTFEVPDDDKVLEGTGENAIARIVVFDNRANRASGVDAETVLTVRATSKPLNIILIAGIGGAVVVVGLLLAVLLRSGGKDKGGRGGGGGGGGGYQAPGGYPPPGGGGYPPPGGGYQAPGGYGGPPQGYPPGGGYGGGYGAAAIDHAAMAPAPVIVNLDDLPQRAPIAEPVIAAPVAVVIPNPVEPAVLAVGGAAPMAASFPAHGLHGRSAAGAASQSVWGQTS